MRYFVTGGAGFIGSHLVDRLVGMGDVTVYDNLSSGSRDFLAAQLGKHGFCLCVGDLLDPGTLQQAMKGHDIVFHLAANPDAREGIEHTDLDLKQGTIATHNVLEAMRREGIGQLVFASSGTVYGETPVVPLPEHYGPQLPISLYGASKLACEGLISAYCHVFGLQAWIYRFANVVGDRATHGVIYDFVRKLQANPRKLEILGDGSQEKPYILVGDCVEGILYGLRHATEQVNLFNLGTDSSTSVKSIARMVIQEVGLSDVGLLYTGGDRGWRGDVPQVRYDVTKMAALGWVARHTSDEAVIETIRCLVPRN